MVLVEDFFSDCSALSSLRGWSTERVDDDEATVGGVELAVSEASISPLPAITCVPSVKVESLFPSVWPWEGTVLDLDL
jgi:hypothetical protein